MWRLDCKYGEISLGVISLGNLYLIKLDYAKHS